MDNVNIEKEEINNYHMNYLIFNEKINEITNKYNLSLDNYKKNFMTYNKNTTSNEYQQIFANNEMQLNVLINEMNTLGFSVQNSINKENEKFNKINSEIVKEKEFYNTLKSQVSLGSNSTSKLMLDDVKNTYKTNNLINLELFFASIVIIFSCINLFSLEYYGYIVEKAKMVTNKLNDLISNKVVKNNAVVKNNEIGKNNEINKK